MGRWSKRTVKNRVRVEDKERKEKGEVAKDAKVLTNRMINSARRFDKAAKKEVKRHERIIAKVANACVLCYSMAVMKDHYRFSSARLKEFYDKWVDTYDAITRDGDTVADDALATVRGTDFDDGDLGYKKYAIREFDKNDDEFDKATGDTTQQRLMSYYANGKMVGFMNTAEVVTMLVLFDYFKFRAVKLDHYIGHVRKFYDLSFPAAKKLVDVLEKRCNTEFNQFAILKTVRENGGIRIYEEGAAKAC